ncbi:enoyl-CoA hydratase/isomerase family protein [Mangrovivirga cuniculi]|uniref:Enoyl-CoA hydratase n=1 Tax=Mangrovivirga cuniculi TaxID=2715131 RepID=A0A4D7JNM9_9BACT|nr:enoyl-CoA hydratase-related protein [Mangrovivirga cuniculi]QCK14362.1 enoyl-CoA hydratase [Mangrovivirga cuniculi]
MQKFENLLLSLEDAILTITVNRPDKLNALNSQTLDEIEEAIQLAVDNNDVKAMIITGSGEKAFVAGADISELAQLNEMTARGFAEKGQEIFQSIENSTKPVIAAVNGFALGGGCELAMACHIRIATKNVKFGQPEVNLGVIPGYGGTQRMTQLIGKSKALEYMMTGDMIDVNEAYRLGLINHIAEDHDDLMSKSKDILAKIMNKAPLAVGMVIDCVNAVFRSDENGYQTEANSFSNCCKSKDFKEGTQAFLEKRKPEFTGE